MQKYKYILLFVTLLLFGLVIRLLYLNSFPTWIGDEELELVINAKSIFLTGWNIDHYWSPFNTTVIKNISPPFPYLFLTPIVGLFPFSLFAARVSSVFAHVGLIIIIFFLVKKLLGDRQAFITLAVTVINPWSFFFSRTNFEAPLAVLFYLLAWVILIYSKGYFIVLAFLPIILAFYSYTGMKLILIPFIVGIVFHAWKYVHNKKETIPLLIFTFLSLGLFAYQVYMLQTEAIGQRVGELALPNAQNIIESVNKERRQAIISPFVSIFSNKIIVYTKFLIGRYFDTFSLALLFVQGEYRATYSLYTHGYFYYIDFIFIIMGFLYLLKKSKTMLLLFIYLLFISAIPAVISIVPTGSAALRSAMIYPLLCMIIGCGITNALERKERKQSIIVGISILCIYLFSCANLGYIYFFRYPMYASEAYGFSKKIVTTYISLHDKTSSVPVVIYVRDPRNFFQHYVYSANLLENNTINYIATMINKPIIGYKNLLIVDCDYGPLPLTPFVTIIESGNCESKLEKIFKEKKYLSIPQLSDSGSIYKIYGDTLCSDRTLGRYPELITFSAMTNAYNDRTRFCDTFIINPDAK